MSETNTKLLPIPHLERSVAVQKSLVIPMTLDGMLLPIPCLRRSVADVSMMTAVTDDLHGGLDVEQTGTTIVNRLPESLDI